MKSAKEQDWFPYGSKLVCYFEVWDDGSIEQISVSKKGLSAAYERAVSGKTKIYAVLG